VFCNSLLYSQLNPWLILCLLSDSMHSVHYYVCVCICHSAQLYYMLAYLHWWKSYFFQCLETVGKVLYPQKTFLKQSSDLLGSPVSTLYKHGGLVVWTSTLYKHGGLVVWTRTDDSSVAATVIATYLLFSTYNSSSMWQHVCSSHIQLMCSSSK